MSDTRDFGTLFGGAPRVRVSAPGRVNLIGEHTDYQGGFVLPMAIPQATTVELTPRDGDEARVFSADVPQSEAMTTFRVGREERGLGWADYVQGVTRAAVESGLPIRGFDARVTSDVPLGSGLSSSAALEVAVMRALREAFALPIDDVKVAMLAHQAETKFVGAPVGVMDQMACSLADTGAALFLDTRALSFQKVPLPRGVSLVVIESGIVHRHAGGEYGVRRAQAEEAAQRLGVGLLRELGPADLPRIEALPEPLRRRARHIVTENARVEAFVAAMRAEDRARLGALLYEGHASLRDDYEVSVPEIDALVEIARGEKGVVGARLTGGGFGGSVVILAEAGARPARAIAEAYTKKTGKTPRVLVG